MKKAILGVLIACGLGFSQVVVSKLSGKRVYMQRQDAGHQDGYNGMITLLQNNAATYGYTFEYSANPLTEAALNAVFARLYPSTVANRIDVLIFCQGEGDRNAAGNPFPNPTVRFGQINTHVKSGGGLINVHGAHGREVSWQNWIFGANLMTDWFVDGYFASPAIAGNGGHFSSGTGGTMTMDAMTLPATDSSAYFIRNILTLAPNTLLPVTQRGYGQPLINTNVVGEWYHFNGGRQYEDGTGAVATHANNRVQPLPVRRGGVTNQGVPDSGIGPVKIFSILTRINSGAGYTPPAPGRHSVWGREVGIDASLVPPRFNPALSATNGRFVAFNPGHASNEYTVAGGYIGFLFLSTLRWAVKDDRGCKISTASNFSPLATVNETSGNPGACVPVSIGQRELMLEDVNANFFGKINVDHSDLAVTMDREGPHVLMVAKVNGEQVFRGMGEGRKEYQIPSLESGFYVVRVKTGGQLFKKMVSIQ